MTYELIENINKIECENCNVLSDKIIKINNNYNCSFCYESLNINESSTNNLYNELDNIYDSIIEKRIVQQLVSNLDYPYKKEFIYCLIMIIISFCTLIIYIKFL